MTEIEDGTWEYMRTRGLWHFDPTCEDPRSSHRVIAQVHGELAGLVNAIPWGEPKTLGTSMVHRSGDSFFDQVQSGNEADARRMGLDPDMEYAFVFDSKKNENANLPAVERLLAQLPLEDAYWKLHRQRPGQVWPMHFDNYHAFEREFDALENWSDPGIRRLWIMLSDWRWGQFVQIGNKVWSHWSAGDILYFDWLVPHGSANCGHEDRLSMLVTGRMTDELLRWVVEEHPRVIEI